MCLATSICTDAVLLQAGLLPSVQRRRRVQLRLAHKSEVRMAGGLIALCDRTRKSTPSSPMAPAFRTSYPRSWLGIDSTGDAYHANVLPRMATTDWPVHAGDGVPVYF